MPSAVLTVSFSTCVQDAASKASAAVSNIIILFMFILF